MKLTHLCVDIRGILNHTRYPSGYRDMLKRDDGTTMPPHEARNTLYDELAKGRKVLQTGPCEGFDYQTGCPGHEQDEAAQ